MSKSKHHAKVGKTVGPVYKRLKSIFKNNEDEALQNILKKHRKERKTNLVAAHTDKLFVWKAKTNFD